jgi:hypothetical protein
MQPQSTDGAQTRMKKCVAVKHRNVAGRFRPAISVRAEKSVFFAQWMRKISPAGNFWVINNDRLLYSIAHDSPFLLFLGNGSKNVFSM